MLGVIGSKASYLKKYGLPYFKIANALFSTSKTYVWAIVGQQYFSNEIDPTKLNAEATVKYSSDFGSELKFTVGYEIETQSLAALSRLHQAAGDELIKQATADGLTIQAAEMFVYDHFYGETNYYLTEVLDEGF